MLIDLAEKTTADLDRVFEKIGASKGVKKPESLIYLTNKSDRGHLFKAVCAFSSLKYINFVKSQWFNASILTIIITLSPIGTFCSIR